MKRLIHAFRNITEYFAADSSMPESMPNAPFLIPQFRMSQVNAAGS